MPPPLPADPSRVFDSALHRRRRDRAAARVGSIAPILQDSAERLLDRLDDTTRRFSRALDLGGRGVVAPLLRARGIGSVVSLDPSPRLAARSAAPAVAGDPEFLPFAPASFDLIVANLSLHWANDLPGTLIQLRQALAPDGLFLAALPGFGTLQNLRDALTAAEAELTGGASPRISPFPELRDGAGLLQRAGFALPVADSESVTLRYRTPMALFADLRAGGETNAVLARDPRTPPRALFPLALSRLADPDTGELAVPLRLLMLTGWAPHESQSRPARPGSADARLADALGSTEGRLPR